MPTDPNAVTSSLATLGAAGWTADPNKAGPYAGSAGLSAPALAPNQFVSAAVTGFSTGWLNAFGYPERFGFRPAGISGTASLTIDASLDGVTAAQTIGVVSLTSADNGLQFYTPPLPISYPFVRITVTADGGGTHAIARGV